MKNRYQVQARNRKGDFTIEVFRTAKEADLRQKQLYHELDKNGGFMWGTIISTNLNETVKDTQ
jgi:hypothetical protein